MEKLIPKADYDKFMTSAKKGLWHAGLCKYGFCSPTQDAKGNPVIPVNEAIRPCEPRFKKDGSYAGIWLQVYKLALEYHDRQRNKHHSSDYIFVPRSSVYK